MLCCWGVSACALLSGRCCCAGGVTCVWPGVVLVQKLSGKSGCGGCVLSVRDLWYWVVGCLGGAIGCCDICIRVCWILLLRDAWGVRAWYVGLLWLSMRLVVGVCESSVVRSWSVLSRGFSPNPLCMFFAPDDVGSFLVTSLLVCMVGWGADAVGPVSWEVPGLCSCGMGVVVCRYRQCWFLQLLLSRHWYFTLKASLAFVTWSARPLITIFECVPSIVMISFLTCIYPRTT